MMARPALSKVGRRSRDEREFLPAALEIIETPASPAGRAIGGMIIGFFVLALAWAILGRVDIVTTMAGKIVPTGRTKVIQPLEIGVIHAIHVRDGQSVRVGEALVELDSTANVAERNRLAGELLAARLDIARLSVMNSEAPDSDAALLAPAGTSPDQLALIRQLLRSQIAEWQAKLAGLDRQAGQHDANRAAIAAAIDKLTATLPLVRQRLEMRKILFDREIGSKLNYLDATQQLIESEKELTVQRHRLVEAEAALAAIAEQRRQTEAEQRRAVLADLTEAEEKAEALAQELVKAEDRLRRQILVAPVDGVVQQLTVHTIGGVVTPAEALMTIVPADSRLEIEATVLNTDIGFVRAGQPAAIKVNTFNFTHYGLLHGGVLGVSADAVASGPSPAAASGAGPAEAPQVSGREPAFTARISLDRTQMQIEGRLVDLRPGMAVTVEVDTGRRRVIDYLLSPLLRYGQESLRER
jgi:hemolysin D